MNFINCAGNQSPELIKKAVIFWSENSAQHINSLLRSAVGTTAVLDEEFKVQLRTYSEMFIRIKEALNGLQNDSSLYTKFLRANTGFINLLERIKYEAFSGYPILQQSVFHYLYEGRYVNAILGYKNLVGNVLVTTYFLPFLNRTAECVYNQIYFWSIIGSMHPSLIMQNNAFYNAINGYAKEFLTGICNSFNNINFALSSLKKPVKKMGLGVVFKEFSSLNNDYLEFLKAVKQTNPKIFTLPSAVRLSASFYGAVDHQIAEHTLVTEINQNIEKILGV